MRQSARGSRWLVGIALGAMALALAGCSRSSGSPPGTASSATAIPGNGLQLGAAAAGDLSASNVVLTRSDNTLTLSGLVTASGAGDILESVKSQVTTPITLDPPLDVPDHGSLDLAAGHRIVLTENARLEPGGTIDLTLHFRTAGDLQVFASFTDG